MHVMITAHLDSPVVGALSLLDGPLAWAMVQHKLSLNMALPPMTDTWAPDFKLPLATWHKNGYWGWCVSSPVGEPVHYTQVEFRRRPPVGPMATYTTVKEHHSGLGPLKARNVVASATWYEQVSWYADITYQPRLEELLSYITHLGARHRNGMGHVTRWEITDAPTGAWQDRPLPDPQGRMMRVRAPLLASDRKDSVCLEFLVDNVTRMGCGTRMIRGTTHRWMCMGNCRGVCSTRGLGIGRRVKNGGKNKV